jgi:hypothetical protein
VTAPQTELPSIQKYAVKEALSKYIANLCRLVSRPTPEETKCDLPELALVTLGSGGHRHIRAVHGYAEIFDRTVDSNDGDRNERQSSRAHSDAADKFSLAPEAIDQRNRQQKMEAESTAAQN